MTTHEHYEELVAAYALDALSPEDVAEFETHLSGCVSCQETLADLRRVSASLGLAVEPVTPPGSLRERTLARATASAQPLSFTAGRERRDVVPKAIAAPKRASFPLALAASLICAAGLGLYSMSLRSQLGAAREMLADAMERVATLRRDMADVRNDAAMLQNTLNVIQSPNVIEVSLRGREQAPAATGRAYIDLAGGLVFSAQRLPALAANRSYQLWVVPQGLDPVSAGVFSVDQTGTLSLTLNVPAGVRTIAAVAVTEEPAGGSIRATTPPLLLGSTVNN